MRCRYSLLLWLLALLSPASSGFETSDSNWPEASATFHVGITGNSLSGGSWNSAFKRAMQQWTDNTIFEFSAVEEFVNPCIDRGGAIFGDGKSSTNFTATVCGTSYGNNVLAVTLATETCTTPSCTGNSIIEEVDIVFNNAESWDIYSGELRNTTIDFERVALHELGHALGLSHEASNAAIMQGALTDIDALQQDDINGANFVYGGEYSISSIYGIDIKIPEPDPLSGIVDTLNFSGELATGDASVDENFIDIFEVTFANDINLTLELSATDFDPLLYLVRMDSTQTAIQDFVFSDDNSGLDSASRISEPVPAGTYWIGVTGISNNSEGAYSVVLSTFATNTSPQFEEFESIFGVTVQVNPNPFIEGRLIDSDFQFENKFLDIYQFEVHAETDLRVDLSSEDFDTRLFLIEILPDQKIGPLVIENDDTAFGSNSRIDQNLQEGNYWIGVTSFSNNSTGNYQINLSVNTNQ